MWNIIEAINVVVEMLIVLLYFTKTLIPKYDLKTKYAVTYTIAAAILHITGRITENSTTLISVTFILLTVISCLLYKGKIVKKIFLSAMFIVIVFMSEILFLGTMTVLNIGLPQEIVQQGIKRIMGMVGTKIIYFWIIVIGCRIFNKKIKDVPLKQWLLIFLMPVLSTVILYIIFYSLLKSTVSGGMIIYCTSVLGLMYINFAVFDFFETYQKQLKLSVLEQVIEVENTNYKLIEKSYSDMRKLKHDMTNQIEVINNLMAKGNRESAQEMLNRFSQEIKHFGAICYTSEPIIDSILNIKLQEACDLQINVSKRINVSEFKLDKIELCRVLGNALDNAIEGCQRSNTENAHIYVSIQQLGNKIAVEISNSSDEVDLNDMRTSKQNKAAHGIGMTSITMSVEKMNGYLSYNCKEGVFSLKMVLLNDKK